jgi:hypothetical protein
VAEDPTQEATPDHRIARAVRGVHDVQRTSPGGGVMDAAENEWQVPVIIQAEPDDKRIGLVTFVAGDKDAGDACCAVELQFQFREGVTKMDILHMLTHAVEATLVDPWIPDDV